MTHMAFETMLILVWMGMVWALMIFLAMMSVKILRCTTLAVSLELHLVCVSLCLHGSQNWWQRN
jgi:hypothetical protein